MEMAGVRGSVLQVATLNSVMLVVFSANTEDVRVISYFQIWGYVLHVEHITCLIKR